MPQRFLRPELRTSDRWNRASYPAQSLFISIVTLADDFGRYDGRPELLWGECCALRKPAVKPQQVAGWLDELDRLDLVQIYQAEGKQYLQIRRWTERARSEKSRFPEPPQRNPAESCGILPPKSSPSPVHLSHRHSTNGSSEPSVQTDSDWLKDLEKSEAYLGINVRREYAKLLEWCKLPRNKRKRPTRGRFINWLNKCEPSLRITDRIGSLNPSEIDVPERFKAWVAERYPAKRDEAMKWKTWADVPKIGIREEWWREEKAKLPVAI